MRCLLRLPGMLGLLLLAAHVGPAAADDSKAGEDLCSSRPSFICAHEVEGPRLEQFADRIRLYEEPTFQVTLRSGQRATIARNSYDATLYFDRYIEDHGLYVFSVVQHEAPFRLVLVSDLDGSRLTVDSLPVFSPDGRFFATVGAPDEMSGDPARIQVFRNTGQSWERVHSLESSRWSVDAVEWVGSSQLEFMPLCAFGPSGVGRIEMPLRRLRSSETGPSAWTLDVDPDAICAELDEE